MDTTAEATHELRSVNPTAAELPDATAGPGQQFRVVLDWRDFPTVASVPTSDRRTALAAFDRAIKSYAADLAAGRVRISVLAEDVWTQRNPQRPATDANPDVAGR